MIHVFDRGFAGTPWLEELGRRQARFMMRWPARYHLADAKGLRLAWQITGGKRSQDHRQIWDLQEQTWPWKVPDSGSGENRLKLLLMVSLVYAFLLSLLDAAPCQPLDTVTSSETGDT